MLSLWFYGECIELFSVLPKRRSLALNFDTYILYIHTYQLAFVMHTHALRDMTVKTYAVEQNINVFSSNVTYKPTN